MAERNDWDKNRDREQEIDRERGGHRMDYGRNREARGYDSSRWENEGGRAESERENRGNFPRYEDRMRDYQDDYRRERGDWSGGSRTADFGQRGDWGRQASWGTYGNRPSYDREQRGSHHEEQGQHSGPSRGRNEGQYGGAGQYGGQQGGAGQYGGGMGSYAGGLSNYGEQGRHAGRGPKNWQRSDERIKEDVNERLTEHPHIDATEIDIQVRNGEVTITGSVEERRIKRMVEDLIEGVSGVKEVHNQLRTQGNGQQGAETGKAAAGSQSSGSQATGAQSRK